MSRQIRKNAVVFGGAGFLGSHVSDSLTEKGFEVTVFDLSESQYLKNGQQMITGDILDSSKVQELVKDGKNILRS